MELKLEWNEKKIIVKSDSFLLNLTKLLIDKAYLMELMRMIN